MRASASRLALLDVCRWWAREEVRAPEPASRPEQRVGVALHALVETGGDAGHPALAALDPEQAEAVWRWYAGWVESEWAGLPWLHEVAYAYDSATDRARVLDRASHRDYSQAGVGELVGTADLVQAYPHEVVVADIKTGVQRDLAPVEVNAQMRFLALCAARAAGVTSAKIILLRVDDDGVTPELAVLDALELDEEADRARARVASIATARPSPGAHCSRCPAVAVCPSAAEVGSALAAVEPVGLSDDRLPEVLAGLSVAESRIEALRGWARDRVKALGEVRLPDGRVARMVSQERESIRTQGESGELAREVLERHGVGGAVKVSVTASWSAIEDALKAAGMAGRDGKAARAAKVAAIREELGRAGALLSTTTEVLRVAAAKERS